jgi:hypothetical protein
MNTATSPQARGSGRRTLVLLFAVFFGAMALAAVLRFSGWQPTGHRNAGQLLKPPVDLRQQAPTLASGQPTLEPRGPYLAPAGGAGRCLRRAVRHFVAGTGQGVAAVRP